MPDFLGAADYYLNKLIFSVGTLIVAVIVSSFIKKTFDIFFLGLRKKLGSASLQAKTRTLKSLFNNTIDIILLLIFGMMILSNWGVNITPILTGAGILGLAFSFGAQSLVKDLIAGFFIIVEGQFNVGDKVIINKLEGEVYKMTLRLTVLKDKSENLIYIPNSQILTVTRLKSL